MTDPVERAEVLRILAGWRAVGCAEFKAETTAAIRALPASASAGDVEAFKEYVHKRLDDAGIPTHPDGPHSKAGCRIGDRLDIALAKSATGNVEAVEDAISEFATAVEGSLSSYERGYGARDREVDEARKELRRAILAAYGAGREVDYEELARVIDFAVARVRCDSAAPIACGAAMIQAALRRDGA